MPTYIIRSEFGISAVETEFFQEFLSEELFSEIGKNILKYTNLFKNMASRLIFMTIFLLSPMFS